MLIVITVVFRTVMRFDVLSYNIWIQHTKINFKPLFYFMLNLPLYSWLVSLKKKTLASQLSGKIFKQVFSKSVAQMGRKYSPFEILRLK